MCPTKLAIIIIIVHSPLRLDTKIRDCWFLFRVKTLFHILRLVKRSQLNLLGLFPKTLCCLKSEKQNYNNGNLKACYKVCYYKLTKVLRWYFYPLKTNSRHRLHSMKVLYRKINCVLCLDILDFTKRLHILYKLWAHVYAFRQTNSWRHSTLYENVLLRTWTLQGICRVSSTSKVWTTFPSRTGF